MTDGHRDHIQPIFMNAVHYVGVSKLMAKLECSKSAAVLYALNEGLFKEGVIAQADYNLLSKRYSRTLKEVIAQSEIKRENSHTPVLTIEQRREKEMLEQKDKQFKGMIEQWNLHTDLKWRTFVVTEAKKFNGKLDSAKKLLELGETK